MGQVLRDRYRVDALLAAGGMGGVYRGTDLVFDAPVAIKENRVTGAASQSQFAREARLLYRLRHPNLPRVIDHFQLEGQGQYLVMDYVEGRDLGQILAERSRIPAGQALQWISQVLDALGYLHSRQPEPVIHRDIKPANIKVTPSGQVYLVDFGLAKELDLKVTTTAGARGATPGYAPPEQYGYGRTDARTDIYSVAATLYALVTGRAPADALDRVTGRATLAAPRSLAPGVTPGVEAALQRAMDLRPAERYATVAEFKQSLMGPSVVQKDPSPGPLLGWVQKLSRVARVAALGSLAGAVLALIIVAIVLTSRPTQVVPAEAATQAPSSTPSRTATGPPTRSPTTVPTQPPVATAGIVASAAPSPSRQPTATLVPGPPPQESPTLAPTPRRPTATAASGASPTMDASPAPSYPAPLLLAPEEAEAYALRGQVTFQWSYPRPLQAGEAFQVLIWQEGDPHLGAAELWFSTAQVVDLDVLVPQRGGPGTYLWSVVVRDRTTEVLLSPEASPWRFTYALEPTPHSFECGACMCEYSCTEESCAPCCRVCCPGWCTP
jgi:serine/threonine-protein kinase